VRARARESERDRSVLVAAGPQRQLCWHHRCRAGTWKRSNPTFSHACASVADLERVAVQALHPLDVRGGVMRHPVAVQSTLDVSARAYLLASPRRSGRSSPPPSAYTISTPPHDGRARRLSDPVYTGAGTSSGAGAPAPRARGGALSLGRPSPASRHPPSGPRPLSPPLACSRARQRSSALQAPRVGRGGSSALARPATRSHWLRAARTLCRTRRHNQVSPTCYYLPRRSR
jgi:hypothetical protein